MRTWVVLAAVLLGVLGWGQPTGGDPGPGPDGPGAGPGANGVGAANLAQALWLYLNGHGGGTAVPAAVPTPAVAPTAPGAPFTSGAPPVGPTTPAAPPWDPGRRTA